MIGSSPRGSAAYHGEGWILWGAPGAPQGPRRHVPTSVPRDPHDELGVEGFSVGVFLPLGHLLVASRLPPALPAPTS